MLCFHSQIISVWSSVKSRSTGFFWKTQESKFPSMRSGLMLVIGFQTRNHASMLVMKRLCAQRCSEAWMCWFKMVMESDPVNDSQTKATSLSWLSAIMRKCILRRSNFDGNIRWQSTETNSQTQNKNGINNALKGVLGCSRRPLHAARITECSSVLRNEQGKKHRQL